MCMIYVLWNKYCIILLRKYYSVLWNQLSCVWGWGHAQAPEGRRKLGPRLLEGTAGFSQFLQVVGCRVLPRKSWTLDARKCNFQILMKQWATVGEKEAFWKVKGPGTAVGGSSGFLSLRRVYRVPDQKSLKIRSPPRQSSTPEEIKVDLVGKVGREPKWGFLKSCHWILEAGKRNFQHMRK